MFALIIAFATPTMAIETFNEVQRDLGRQVLLDAGWSQEEIDDMIPDEALKDYAGATLVSREVKYLEVAEDSVVTEFTKEEFDAKEELIEFSNNMDFI